VALPEVHVCRFAGALGAIPAEDAAAFAATRRDPLRKRERQAQ
jgi:hypothetical protein